METCDYCGEETEVKGDEIHCTKCAFIKKIEKTDE